MGRCPEYLDIILCSAVSLLRVASAVLSVLVLAGYDVQQCAGNGDCRARVVGVISDSGV